MDVPSPGDLFEGRYRLDEVLGEGGSAIVFRALDMSAHRTVALKILKPDSTTYRGDTQRRFEREVRIIANLRDPHTVTMFDFGKSETGLLYMVFEHVGGVDLSELISRRGTLDPWLTVHILRQVLSSLREAHAAGLLHRDVKPENIRVYEFGDDPYRVKLLDFGIARAGGTAPTITRTGELVGTPRYMSPEALMERELSPASDIYSVGILAYEMLLGRHALHGNQWGDQLDRLMSGHVFSMPRLAQIPTELRQLITHMVARKPEDRIQSAAAALEVLRRLRWEPDDAATVDVAPTLPLAPAPRITPEPAAEPQPRVAAWIGVAVAVVALGFVGFEVMRQPGPPPDQALPPRLPAAVIAVPPEAPPPARADAGPDMQTAAARDAAAQDAGADASESKSGCGAEPPFLGAHSFESDASGTLFRWLTRVPGGYQNDVPHPVVILFHHDDSSPEEIINDTRLDKLADKEGIIIIAPRAMESRAWREARDIEGMKGALDVVTEDFCVDRTRVFAVGHGTGSRAVEQLSCSSWITATATTSYIPTVKSLPCQPATPRPAIQITPTKTGHIAIDGGAGCGPIRAGNIPLADYEAIWRARNECTDKSKPYVKHADGSCVEFDCETPYVSCRIVSGLGWPGTQRRDRLRDPFKCDGTPTHFPSTDTIWKFFESVEPLNLADPPAQ